MSDLHELRSLVEELMRPKASGGAALSGTTTRRSSTKRTASTGSPDLPTEIVDGLVKSALMDRALIDRVGWNNYRKFSTGNTAEAVGQLELLVPCVLKLDTDEKLVNEAQILRRLFSRSDLPPSFRALFPRVYASHDVGPLYAYLMETFSEQEGFLGLNKVLWNFAVDEGERAHLAARVATALMDELLGAYTASCNRRLRPDVFLNYVERITGRLQEASDASVDFSPRVIRSSMRGQLYRPWTEYVDFLSSHRQEVQRLAPPFSTFVHGDPNPENVLARIRPEGIELRFIDVKEWGDGDYVFDVAKFVHHVLVTGPMEHDPQEVAISAASGSEYILNHSNRSPGWALQMEASIKSRVREFAVAHGDDDWELRYTLGLASNLLGLPATRQKREQSAVARVTYVEGLHWLDVFCRHLGFTS